MTDHQNCYRTAVMWIPEVNAATGSTSYTPAFQYILTSTNPDGSEKLLHFLQCRVARYNDGTYMTITSRVKHVGVEISSVSEALRDLQDFEREANGRRHIKAMPLQQGHVKKLRGYTYMHGAAVKKFQNHPDFSGYRDAQKKQENIHKTSRAKSAQLKLRPPRKGGPR